VPGPRTIWTDLGDARIAHDIAGDGPPVVLIHGWACRRADLAPIAADLARDHRVLSLDLPWHGQSTSVTRYWPLDDLAAAVDAVVAGAGMRDAVLVGHSMGAAVAVETVIAGTGRHVISLDGLTFMHLYPRQPHAAIAAYLAPFRDDFTGAIRDLCDRAAGPGCDPGLIAGLAAEMGAVDPQAAIAMMEELMRWDMDAALARGEALGLTITTLAAVCMLSPGALARYAHRLRITPVDMGGHFFPLQEPGPTADLIRDAIAASA
jgi:pimeloyl-ACP methyl ester carboxylesterase